jgi:iron(III) transport system substrate-binding protein
MEMGNGTVRISAAACVMAAVFLLGSGFSVEAGGRGETQQTSSKPLIIYSNSVSDGRGEWLTEQAKAAGFEIEYVDLGGGAVKNRLIAEKNNPLADLVFGLSPMDYEQLKAENVLLKWEPAWAKEVDMSLGDPDGYYYPIVIQAIFLMYNADALRGREPRDYTELATNPVYKDKYVIGSFTGGTPRAILMGMFSRYKDPNGELGISAEGWNMIKQYFQNGHLEQSGEDTLGNLISGERPIMGMWSSGYLQRIQERNLTNVSFMNPAVGVPFLAEQVALIRGSKNVEKATAFANWFGQADLQAKWSAKFGTTPAHPEALKLAAPEVQELMKKISPQTVDWTLGSKMLDAWVEKVQLEFVE